MVITLLSVGVQVLMKGSLKQVWKSINLLQFWVFIPFWTNLKAPSNAENFLQALHNFAVGELVDK